MRGRDAGDPRRNVNRAGVAAALLASVVLFAGGTTTGLLIASTSTAEEPATTAPPSFPAVVDFFADERSARGVPVVSELVDVWLPAGGIVTSTECAPGAVVSSGTSPIAVDGRPLLALATSRPLHRDLTAGAQGEDVIALQEELVRLGHQLEVTGRYDAATRAAVVASRTAVGVANPGSALGRAQVLWLPEPEVEVGTCAVAVGAVAVPGGVFATTATSLTGIRVEAPASAMAGDRLAVFGDVRTVVGAAGGVVTDPDLLAAVAASPEYAFLGQGMVPDQQLTFGYILAEPIEVLAVPPAALATEGGTTGCLTFAGADHEVEIVASRLGLTFVRLPEGTAPPTEVTRPATARCAP